MVELSFSQSLLALRGVGKTTTFASFYQDKQFTGTDSDLKCLRLSGPYQGKISQRLINQQIFDGPVPAMAEEHLNLIL
jgi:hypothetical protein